MNKEIKEKHFCDNIDEYDLNFLLQIGKKWKRKILIVGESPAPTGWIVSGKAFYNLKNKIVPSGLRLNKLLNCLDLSVEECSFTEICKCFVGNDRKQIKHCANKCWPIFLKQVYKINPQIIILLGLETLKIFNSNLNIDLKVGELASIEINGYLVNILPIFHPSPINPNSLRLNNEIFKRLNSALTKIINNIKSLYE